MMQEQLGPVEDAVGYVLKESAVALRNAMDAALRPLQLSTPQYSCLELLGQRPAQSNAELARGTFVTRQSMNVVLQGLERDGLVTRPATAARGRELPAALTDAGRDRLREASSAVREVQERMCAGLTAERRRILLEVLRMFRDNLAGPS